MKKLIINTLLIIAVLMMSVACAPSQTPTTTTVSQEEQAGTSVEETTTTVSDKTEAETDATVAETDETESDESVTGTDTETDEPTADVERTFGIIYPIIHPFFEPVGVDAEKYGEEKGWEVIARGPDKSDVQQQIEIMENMISMKVDGIAIGPTDPQALAVTIDKAIEEGIKVICMETDSPTSNRLAYIGTDNYNAGRHMGEVIGRTIGGEGDIMILTGLPTQLSLNERIRGIEEYLEEKYPDVNIIDTQASEGDPQKAVAYTENMIQAHPDFKAIIGIDATAGPAMISVWKAQGWLNNDDHKIITFDDMPDNLQGMEDGYISAIVSQRQWTWGEGVLNVLNDLVEGKTVEDYLDTGSIEITKDNVDTYRDEPAYVEGE